MKLLPSPSPAPVAVASPVVIAAAPEPLEAPEPPMPSLATPYVGGQFHAQDELKQYSFSHWGGPNTRVETKDALGRTRGSFAYVDPVGDVQVRKYAAAPLTGFKVAASDLPVDTPEVAILKAAHEKNYRAIKEVILGTSA
ncbi:cuticle protein 7-like [Eriocheir sinensis]|uniref:cuticle protein 7-like n=1 Tax=Eriocheir sinensis TaxID=95602 RepID=UPI0021C7CBA7|nr:cuticle protein 7-like [Eriocheir sinensis]